MRLHRATGAACGRARRGAALGPACAWIALLLAGGMGCATALPEVDAAPRDDGMLAALLAAPLGEDLDASDRELAVETIRRALADGAHATWQNPETGNAGSVTPFGAYENLEGRSCREFHQRLEVQDAEAVVFDRACRRPDGSWEIVG